MRWVTTIPINPYRPLWAHLVSASWLVASCTWASTVDVSEGREEREGREGEGERYVSLCLTVTGRGVCMHQMSMSMG